jgi:hypothetical protein
LQAYAPYEKIHARLETDELAQDRGKAFGLAGNRAASKN